MSDTRFTASNGWYVEGNDLRHPTGAFWCYSHGESALALGEYYAQSVLANRDAELGRWRSVKHPDYFVIADGSDCAVVYDDTTLHNFLVFRQEAGRRAEPEARKNDVPVWVAREYFAAHPVPEPKPWEQAQPGELWYLEDLSKGGAYLVVTEDAFGNEFIGQSCRFSTKFIGITTGRRIWPEAPHE
jgi:hypothetical protein